MKILKKALLYTLAAFLVILIGLFSSAVIFKDRIIQRFIAEVNKNLSTPVKIGKIDISLLESFPNLSIVLNDVYVEDSHPGEYPLLTAHMVSFTLNVVEVWNGQYTIRGLKVVDSETNLKINEAGNSNYTIVKSGSGGGSVSFDLKNVSLKNTLVTYLDQSIVQHHEFSSANLLASISADHDQYRIAAEGDVVIEQIGVGKSIYLRKKIFDVKALLDYNDTAKSIKIQPSVLMLAEAQFELSGSYEFKDKNKIDLHTTGKDTDIQTLLSFFPESSAENFKKYKSKGDVYFDLKLTGEISKQKSPFLTMAFGMRNVSLQYSGLQSHIEGANLEGSFATPSLSRMNHAELFLKNISGVLNGDSVNGNFSMSNFEDPYVRADFHGEVNADELQKFFPMKDVRELSGRIKANVSLSGMIEMLKNKSTAQQVRTEGTVELKDLDFLLGKDQWHFRNLNGGLRFNNNDLAMSDLRGQFENSDFLLNGFFKNIVTFLIFEDQPIGIEADLKSEFLDIDQLFAIGFGSQQKGPYQFSISRNLNLNFNCDVKRMQFKKFFPTDVRGDLLVKGEVAVSRNIQLNAMGGALTLSGIVDAKNPKAIDLISSVKLNNIDIDSLFYVFGDFNQDFIGYKVLKGKAFADINFEATLNEALHIFSETLIADASIIIKKGELNNFGPMQKLNKYLDDEGLSKLRFADLKNDIHIENKTIFMPPMEISTNVTRLQLSGTHTFDKQIDYRVIAPLRNKKKIDPDEAFGSIEEDTKGQSKVYLKIVGTTDKYDVLYDKDAVKKKIGKDLKREVQELKDAFKLKGKKKKKELELEKEDYFDWENHEK